MDDQAHGYAVGAFNVEDMEMIQAVIAAAEAEHAPVLPQTTPGTLCAQAAAPLCLWYHESRQYEI